MSLLFCFIFLFAASTVIFYTECSAEQEEALPRIINGHTALQSKWPWIVLVTARGATCGGSIVAPHMVLTAKHCVVKVNRTALRVTAQKVSRYRRDRGEQNRGVKRLIFHDTDDMALLHLDRPFTLNKKVKSLSIAPYLPPVGSLFMVAGWGWTRPSTNSVATTLQEVTLPIVSRSACVKERVTIKETQLCAGWGNGSYANICHGDSGSPAVYWSKYQKRFEQVAVATEGPSGCPLNHHYAVFTPVTKARSWIHDNVECSKPGYWISKNVDRPEEGVGDIEKRPLKACGGRRILCLSYSIHNTSHCDALDPKCVHRQRIKFSRTYGLRCYHDHQSGVYTWDGWRLKVIQCVCCDYKLYYKCPY